TNRQTSILYDEKMSDLLFFFIQAEDGIRDRNVTGVQTCALPISWRFWIWILTQISSISMNCCINVKRITKAENNRFKIFVFCLFFCCVNFGKKNVLFCISQSK